MATIKSGAGSDRKRLACFGIGRGHGQRLDGVLDRDGRMIENMHIIAAASVIFDSVYINEILAGSTKGEVKVVANGTASCHIVFGNQINGRDGSGAIRSGWRC